MEIGALQRLGRVVLGEPATRERIGWVQPYDAPSNRVEPLPRVFIERVHFGVDGDEAPARAVDVVEVTALDCGLDPHLARVRRASGG